MNNTKRKTNIIRVKLNDMGHDKKRKRTKKNLTRKYIQTRNHIRKQN